MRLILSTLVFLLIGAPAQGKLPEPETLLSKILESYQHVYQFNLKIKVRVYDPEAFHLLEESIEGNVPYIVKDKTYTQNLIFMRDEYQLIETKDLSDNLLHLYFKEGERVESVIIDEKRSFHPEDVVFPHSIFFTKFTSLLKSGLLNYGIPPLEVKLVKHDFRYLYQLGTDEENVKVDQDNFRVLEANRIINIRGRDYGIKISFQNWDQHKKRIPRLTQYFINSRLFKELRITAINHRGNKTRARNFIDRYKRYLSLPTFSTQIDYAR